MAAGPVPRLVEVARGGCLQCSPGMALAAHTTVTLSPRVHFLSSAPDLWHLLVGLLCQLVMYRSTPSYPTTVCVSTKSLGAGSECPSTDAG